jgi:hypothetical protein
MDRKARLKPVPGRVYWLKWLQGTQQKYSRVGSDPNDAVAAQLRQERLLPPEEARKPNRQRLADAIEYFFWKSLIRAQKLGGVGTWTNLLQFASEHIWTRSTEVTSLNGWRTFKRKAPALGRCTTGLPV